MLGLKKGCKGWKLQSFYLSIIKLQSFFFSSIVNARSFDGNNLLKTVKIKTSKCWEYIQLTFSNKFILFKAFRSFLICECKPMREIFSALYSKQRIQQDYRIQVIIIFFLLIEYSNRQFTFNIYIILPTNDIKSIFK